MWLYRSVVLLVACLAGCSTPPKSIVHQPTTARAAAQPEPLYGNGSIFQANGGRGSLFEDRIARQIGDILTISIEEKLTATTKSTSNADRKSTLNISAPSFNIPYAPGALKKLGNLNVEGSGQNKFEGKGETNAANTFTGTITVTVVDVLPNGNLLVSGEKQIAIHDEHEFLRFSGIVSPADIKAGNQVSSLKVADARIEQRANGIVGASQDAGWLAKFFMTVMPF